MRDADVTHLAEYLRAEFEDIRVVCYLRRQDLMATSRINEGLRAGFPQRLFPTVKEDGALPPPLRLSNADRSMVPGVR